MLNWKRIRKEEDVAYIEIQSQYLPKGTEENNVKTNQDSRCPCRDSNTGTPAYESRGLLLRHLAH
jgi:hypothetical protein